MMNDSLIVFALEAESANEFVEYSVLYTGIGKIQACASLLMRITTQKPRIVINMGTAGSNKHKPGTVVNPTKFVQRDMDATCLGFDMFQTPFSSIGLRLDYGIEIKGIPQAVCGTGDNFSVTDTFGNGLYDVVDMEAYSLAYVCKKKKIPFLCLKYISDSADENASQDWDSALKTASSALKKTIDEIVWPQLKNNTLL